MIYPFYGNTNISDDINLDSLSSSSKFRIFDQDPNEMLPMDWIGDINHDGLDDLAARSSPGGGDLYVIYGKIGGLSDMNITNISNRQGFRIKGRRPLDYTPNYRYYSDHAGDVNGDGIDDFIVGTVQNNRVKSIYIVYGKISGFSDIDLENFTPSDGFKIIDSAKNDRLGISPRNIGDVNNDGFGDILIDSRDDVTKFSKGSIIFGQRDRRPNIDVADAENLLTLEANTLIYFDFLDPIKPGDLNGDGIDDLVFKTLGGIYGLYGSNCEEYIDCPSPMPSICYASKGCACRNKNMIMQDLSCVSLCSPGYYQESDSTCKICSVNCKVCSGNPACETCFDGYLLQDSLCVSSCSDGYLKVGSICQSIRLIIGATVGAMAALVIVIIATVYVRKRLKFVRNYDIIPFPAMRFESEFEMKISGTPAQLWKGSYLEQPIERVQNNNDPHSICAIKEEEDENNHETEGIDMNDQQQVEYEFRVKRAD